MSGNKKTWIFKKSPLIISSAAVGGKKEGEGPLKRDFDWLYSDDRAHMDTFEQAEVALLQKACDLAIEKAGLKPDDLSFFLAGDLMNQITSSSFVGRKLAVPYVGVFSACATAMEGLALSALLVAAGAADNVLTASVSDNKSAERQFRYPTEYGVQKPPTSQNTATAAGAAVVSNQGNGIEIDSATIGQVIDYGVNDPQDMGSAMAPAAADTIIRHFKERGMTADDYDYVVTGDLGKVGQEILFDLLYKEGLIVNKTKFLDCGRMLYDEKQNVFCGGSGAGCIASVGYGHLFKRMLSGEIKNMLLVATGALLSPISTKQGESIPAVAHAVALGRR